MLAQSQIPNPYCKFLNQGPTASWTLKSVRELTCACVGGDSKVPLGFVSLSENLIMLAAGIWMLAR